MKKLFLFLCPIALILLQPLPGHGQTGCGSEQANQYLLDHNPQYAHAISVQKQSWASSLQGGNLGLILNSGGDTVYEIPIVIHVMHTGQALGSPYNPSDTALYSLVDYLNEVYAATWAANPDTASGGVYVPIRFKLAKRTPSCTATNGITRTNASSVPGYSAYGIAMPGATQGAPEADIKALSIWPNTDYLNIWIVTDIQGAAANGGAVAGYGYFPGTPANIDGVVIRRDQTYWSIAHEIGHALGLYHTFQGSSSPTTCPPNANCNTDGDLVCDTDPHPLVSGCPLGTNPCTSLSYVPVVYNIMNYSSCPDRFTTGQKNRMVFMLLHYRYSLLTSLGVDSPGVNPGAVAVPGVACTPTGTGNPNNTYDVGPRNVSLADMFVSTQGYTNDGNEYYVDHTVGSCLQGPAVAHLQLNTPYTLSVTTGFNPENVRAWIDYNNDSTFQASELIMSSNGDTSFQEHSVVFTLPNTGLVTCTPLRMRVASDFYGATAPQPCANLEYGQTEDFIVIAQSGATPSVSITASDSSICAGSSVTFTATPVNGGTTPAYQWKKNGSNVGTNSSTYTTSALANGDLITCEMTSSSTCAATPTATSPGITMSVNSSATPAITIAASNTAICSGSSVTFTATPTNGGASPAYQWKKNGNNVGTNSATYTTASIANGDIFTCTLTSSSACALTPVTSSGITMTVNPSLTPSIHITASDTVICSGSSVTFTATANNGGANPAFQWKKNGNNVGTNSAIYTTAAIANGDIVTCVLTSNAVCALPSGATSGSITMAVNSILTPSVSIIASDTAICSGTSVTFTATPTNGGTSPAYQWKKNGNNVGTNSVSYTTSSITNGDVITCVLTSNSACASPLSASSAGITMSVNTTLPAGVSIAASDTSICSGTNVTFTATPANGGTNPAYQWKKNGNNVGTNSATYSSSALANGDVITCILTSSSACASPASVSSTGITMTVDPGLTPAVSITASDSTICAGTNVTFTATAANGGTNPIYQWKKNGNNVGTNSTVYSSSSLANGDVITCTLTSNADCVFPAGVTSAGIIMNVNPVVTPSIYISANDTVICSGTNVTFTATPANGGTNPAYQWKRNGSNTGPNSATYSSSALANGDVVACVLTSNAACASPASVNSAGITMTVNPALLPAVSITASDTEICTGTNVTFTATPVNGGTSPAYQWKKNGNNIGSNSATYSSSSITNGDVITCVLTSNAACALPSSATSSGLTMAVDPFLVPSISITATDSAICLGSGVTFTTTVTNGGTNPMYQWNKNGTSIGANSAVYSSSSLINGDVITCILNSNAACVDPVSDTSLPITMAAGSEVVPTLGIQAHPGTSVAPGAQVLFTTLPTNGGDNPQYEWYKNGQLIPGAHAATYTAIAGTDIMDGDAISGLMRSSAPCAIPDTALSSSLTMEISPVGIDEVTKKGNILQLYPNPNDGQFVLKGQVQEPGAYSVVITNVLGQEVFRQSHETGKKLYMEIDLKRLAQGTYYLHITLNHTQIAIKKFVKIK